MIRAALDSNILVYAELEPESDKGRRAQDLIAMAAPGGVLAVQSLLEVLAVVRRKRPQSLASAMEKLSAWSAVFELAPTTALVAARAVALIHDHRFQVWDAVIWTAVEAAGASVLFTEDLQDGFAHGGLRALNPYRLDAGQLKRLFED